jgi:polyphosphate glucokinase
MSAPAAPERGPTLAIDVGGTGLKAAVLDDRGEMEKAQVRVATTYPMPPERLVATLTELAAPLPAFTRVSIGFPGVVRDGRVLSAPHFVTKHGPGTKTDKALETLWAGFDLAGTMQRALDRPVRVANDADLQGAAVIAGEGLELVITLGTGVGTGLFWHGRLAPHLELAHHPLADGETYNERLGDAARKSVGTKRWRSRVLHAIDTLYGLLHYDHLFVGGGNSARLVGHVPRGVTIVDNEAGILGGIKLWEGNGL